MTVASSPESPFFEHQHSCRRFEVVILLQYSDLHIGSRMN